LKIISENDFTRLISTDEVIILFFASSSCGGCKMMKKVMDELEKENFNIYLVNTSVPSILINKLNISSIPTTVIIYKKKVIAKEIGYRSKEYLEKILNNL